MAGWNASPASSAKLRRWPRRERPARAIRLDVDGDRRREPLSRRRSYAAGPTISSDRPRHAGGFQDRLVDAARSDAITDRVELGDLALQRAVEAVRRATPGRQHDRVDGLDTPFDA